MAQSMRQKPQNSLGVSNRMSGKVPTFQNNDDDNESMFNPPANDFYKKAARLSVWSKSDADQFIIDGHSSSDESSEGSVRRLSDNSSFNGSQRSASNSIAGLSKGSFTSQGSKGIRNFLGGKFHKRAKSIT